MRTARPTPNAAGIIRLECGDKSPLSDWQTCLPVPKRGRARALQNSAPVQVKRTLERKERELRLRDSLAAHLTSHPEVLDFSRRDHIGESVIEEE
jgi:hypothetical protein